MASKRGWHLVTYDIRDPSRWRLVYKRLKGYGERVQYSVFRVQLTDTELQRMRWELERDLAAEDDLLIIPLCASCSSRIQFRNREGAWPDDEPLFKIIG